MAERNSDSVSATLNPASGFFHASSAAVATPSTVGVKVWPRPASTPANPVIISAADVVISAPSPVWMVSTLSRITSTPMRASASKEKESPSSPPAHPSSAAKAKVRRPASFRRRSRSIPMNSPIADASASRARVGP